MVLLSVVSILWPSPMRTIFEHSPPTFPTAGYRWCSSVSLPPLKAWLSMSIDVKLPFLLLFQPTPPTSAPETCCFLFPLLLYKCLGAWWSPSLSCTKWVENIKKARCAFSATGSRVFHGTLNPLSSKSIVEHLCVTMPVWCRNMDFESNSIA